VRLDAGHRDAVRGGGHKDLQPGVAWGVRERGGRARGVRIHAATGWLAGWPGWYISLRERAAFMGSGSAHLCQQVEALWAERQAGGDGVLGAHDALHVCVRGHAGGAGAMEARLQRIAVSGQWAMKAPPYRCLLCVGTRPTHALLPVPHLTWMIFLKLRGSAREGSKGVRVVQDVRRTAKGVN